MRNYKELCFEGDYAARERTYKGRCFGNATILLRMLQEEPDLNAIRDRLLKLADYVVSYEPVLADVEEPNN